MRTLLMAALLLVALPQAFAEEVSQQHAGLTVSAELKTVGDNWQDKPVLLMTHGTLAHNRMEIMATLQNLFAERGYSSLAINLSLGVDKRQGMYDCKVTHTHKHTDALDEIGIWREWLKAQGVKQIVLLGHSRGGNQSAWFAAERDDASIKAVLLVAPPMWDAAKAAKGYKKRYRKVLDHVMNDAQSHLAANQPDFLMEPVDILYCKDAAATAESFVSYYRDDRRRHTPYLLEAINKPTLVFAGTEDRVVEGLAEEMSGVVQRDNINLQNLEGADHYFRDLYAEDLADMAVEFLESLQ